MPDLVDGSHYETSAFSGSRHELPGDESVPVTRRLLAGFPSLCIGDRWLAASGTDAS